MKILNFLRQHKLVIVLSLLIISFSFFFMLFINMEPDYYWHLKAGEYMADHQKILTHDVFSWVVAGKYWMSHEWLFELLLYGLKNIFGNLHVFVYCFVSVTTLGLFLFFTNKKSYLKNIPFSLVWISFSFLIFSTVSCRPQLLSFLFLAFTIYALMDLFYHTESKKIYFLPVVSLLWANVHGGSSNLPYLLCFLFLCCGLFQFRLSKIEATRLNKQQMSKYLLVMILCILVCCINPHGIKLLLYPYQNMADHLMLTTIAEWQPTNLNIVSHYGYIFFVFLILLIFLCSDKKIRLLDFVLFLFVLYLGFKSIRFWFYAYIVCSFFVFFYIKKRKEDPGTIPLILLISFACFFFFVNQFHYTKILNSSEVSSEAIQVLKKERPKRLYNDYDYGGYLIANDILVFMDGRADLYSKYNYKDYQTISRLTYTYTNLIEKYKFDYFITKKKSGLASFLSTDSIYERIFHDKNTVIYKKKAA